MAKQQKAATPPLKLSTREQNLLKTLRGLDSNGRDFIYNLAARLLQLKKTYRKGRA